MRWHFRRPWKVLSKLMIASVDRRSLCTDRIVCRTFILVLCVTLYTMFRPVASPAVVRCWLVLRRTGWCMAFSHVRVTTFEYLAVLGIRTRVSRLRVRCSNRLTTESSHRNLPTIGLGLVFCSFMKSDPVMFLTSNIAYKIVNIE